MKPQSKIGLSHLTELIVFYCMSEVSYMNCGKEEGGVQV